MEQLDRLIGERDYLPFLNSRNELYRERKMKEHPPPREEALQELMAANPQSASSAPILVKGGEIVLGFDEDAMRARCCSWVGPRSQRGAQVSGWRDAASEAPQIAIS